MLTVAYSHRSTIVLKIRTVVTKCSTQRDVYIPPTIPLLFLPPSHTSPSLRHFNIPKSKTIPRRTWLGFTDPRELYNGRLMFMFTVLPCVERRVCGVWRGWWCGEGGMRRVEVWGCVEVWRGMVCVCGEVWYVCVCVCVCVSEAYHAGDAQ